VQSGKYEEVELDGDTFRSYLQMRPFDKLNRKIAAITQAELHDTDYRPFLQVLRLMGLNTLADVERVTAELFDDAYQLALYQLGSTDIDILAGTIGLQNICIVHILKNGGGKTGLAKFFDTINGTNSQNEVLAEMVYEQACHLSFMNAGAPADQKPAAGAQ
jgi:hypothetical protein